MAPISEPTEPEPNPVLGAIRQSANDASEKQTAKKTQEKRQTGDTIMPPMLRVPPEISAQIFTGVVQSKREEYKEAVVKLMLVCKSWRDIVSGTPAVWSFIDYDDGQGYVRIALTNSGDYPLTIWQYTWDTADRFQWFMEEIVKHSRRWIALDLTMIPQPEQIFIPIMTASVPILRSFRIRWTGDAPEGIYWPTLFKGEPLPNLRHLDIRYFEVGLELKSITALQYIHIALDWALKDKTHITPDIFAAILRNNPNLSYVCLWDAVSQEQEPGSFRPSCSDPIILPHLQNLDFDHTHSSYIDAILPFLVLPEMIDSDLEMRNKESPASIPRPFPGLERPFTSPTRRVWITHGSAHWSMEVSVGGDRSGYLQFKIRRSQGTWATWTLNCMISFMERLPSSVRCALRTEDDLLIENEEKTSGRLHQMRYLRKLDLVDLRRESILSYIRFMSVPQTQNPNAYPFPRLEVLRIEKLPSDGAEPLLRMLRTRYANTSITRLEVLEVPALPPNAVQQVEEIVGTGVLTTGTEEPKRDRD